MASSIVSIATMLEQQASGQNGQKHVQCENDNNFAVICSFFYKFSESLGITYNIQQLKDMIEDNNNLSEELVELHIKLLRKRRKYINKDRWERALVKFCAEYSNVDSWELERYGYKNSKLSIKLEILKRLLEAQFDYNSKFKLEVNANDAMTLRIVPIGRDVNGRMYWYQLDPDYNFRVYREDSDDDQSWCLVCQSRQQLETLIADLSVNNTIEVLNKEEVSSLSDTNEDNEDNEDSYSNLNNKTEPVWKGSKNKDKHKTKHISNDLEMTENKSDENQFDINLNIKTDLTEDEDNKCTHFELKNCENNGNNSNESVADCVKSEIIKEKCFTKNQVSETPLEDENQINGQIKEEFNFKENCLNSFKEVNGSDVKSSDKKLETKDDKNENSIFDEKHNFFDEIDRNLDKQKKIKSENDFYINNNNNNNDIEIHNLLKISSAESQLECDVKDVIEAVVDRVCIQTNVRPLTPGLRHNTGRQTPSCAVLTDHTLLSIEQTVSALCDFLVDEICRQSTDNQTDNTRNRGRGRPPARARGRGRGRGRGRESSSVAKVYIFNKNTRSKSVSQELSEDNEPVVEQPQKRCSRRIQALQEKKALEMSEQVKQEQKRIEQMAKKRCALLSAKGRLSTDEELSNQSTRKRNKRKLIASDEEHEQEEEEGEEEEEESNSSEVNLHQQKTRRRRKGCKPGAKPWEESDSSNEDSDESEEIEEHEEEDDVLKFTSDDEDEFACEEPEVDAEPVVVRRARTVRKIRSDSSANNESSSESEVENDDKPCGRCGKYDHPEWILLCDKCDDGFHTACLRPPLMLIPDGDWFCPPCEHKMLCQRLSEELSTLSVHLVKKEREEIRKQRLKFVDINISNMLKKQNSDCNRRKGSVCKKNNEVSDDLIAYEVEDVNHHQLDDQNVDNSDVKSNRKSKNRKTRVANEEDEQEDNGEQEEDDDEDSDVDDDIGKAVWSDDEDDDDNYVAIKSRRNRSRKNINYQFTEFDALIKSAIEQDLDYEFDASATEAGIPKPESKGKDISNIIANKTEDLDFSVVTPASESIEQITGNEILSETDLKTNDNSAKDENNTIFEEKLEEPLKQKDSEEKDQRNDAEEEDISDENESKLNTNRKRANRRSSASARKRHRGLNDLSDTTEDDDSDEDFKGEDSATEVEEGSDEEFVDDASTQEDEEVSEDSDFKYNKRRSSRNVSKSKSSKGKNRSKVSVKSGRRKGYRRDAFVVSSDDSDEYQSGRSSKKTRAAARKRISYREETTTEEESEEEYYSNSNKNKSNNKNRNRNESESSEEWGGRKAAKNKQSKNSSDDEEEDEEGEEEGEEEEEEEEEEEKDEKDEKEENKDKKIENEEKEEENTSDVMPASKPIEQNTVSDQILPQTDLQTNDNSVRVEDNTTFNEKLIEEPLKQKVSEEVVISKSVHTIDPRMERPFMSGHLLPPNVCSMPPFGGQQSNLRPDLRPRIEEHGIPPVQRFSGIHPPQPPYYQQLPPAGHPYYSRPLLRQKEPVVGFNAGTHIRPPISCPIGANLPPVRNTVPNTNSSITGQLQQLPTLAPHPNFRPGPPQVWNQIVPNRNQVPVNNFGSSHPPHPPHPPHPSTGPPYYPQEAFVTHSQTSHVMSLSPSPYPPGSYHQNYGYFGTNANAITSPNATFMIQNLLQHRPPAPE